MFIMMIQEEKSKGQPEKNNSSLPFPSLPPRVFDYYLFCMELEPCSIDIENK